MRTQGEIVPRIEEVKVYDVFGFESQALIPYLDFEHARPYIKEDVTQEEWDELRPQNTREGILTECKDYMEFAIGKATDHRGLSSSRSISKMASYVWLLSDEDFSSINWDKYRNYGAPILKAICDRFEFDFVGLSYEPFIRMSQGLRCREDCEDGCNF